MEEETCEICLNFVLALLEDEKKNNELEHLGRQIEMIILELNLLKMFFRGLACLEQVECDLHLRFAVKSMMHKLMQIVVELVVHALCGWMRKTFFDSMKHLSSTQEQLFLDAIENMPEELRQMVDARYSYDKMINLDVVMYDIRKKIDEQLRPEARDVCTHLLGRADYNCTSCPPIQKKFSEYIRDTTSFLDLIFQNLKAILNSNLIAPAMKQRIALIQGELEKHGMFVNPIEVKKLSELISRARTGFSRISCLTYLYWSSNGKDESVSYMTRAVISGFQHQNIHGSTSRSISSIFQPTVIMQLLARHLDFLLGDFVLPMKHSLQEALIFMLSFIMDPPELDSKDSERIWEKVCTTFNKFHSLIYSICSGEMKEEICKAKIFDFLVKVDRVKAKVRELFVIYPYSSQYPAPSTNAIGFLNSLVVNLSGISERGVNMIPYLKHICNLLYIELKSIQLHLKIIVELLQDNRYKEMDDLWQEMINMVYNVDYFTKLCFRESSFTRWYDIIALLDDTKVLKIQIKKLVGGDKVYKKKNLNYEQMDGAANLRLIGKAFESERAIMGFTEDKENVIEKLLHGSKSLSIVSISGSGGQGKTTLAKIIYDDLNVRHHFQSLVWIYISKDFPFKKILVQIMSNTKGGGAKLETEDLIVEIWRSFKRKRYLIVLDDIWDVEAWEQLKQLFPDDKNASRILFTTRNHDLALRVAESTSFSHRLPLFSDGESWELMRGRVFGSNSCDDEELVEIGKKIASHCKGLPLAVILIAGVLGRIEKTMDSWNKVAENLKEHLAQEGCGNVLELSYMYLADHLKSCFLYFATFRRGKDVRAKKLRLLWIGEGFAVEDDLATEYLRDLVSLGLVDVTEGSSIGGIKTCNVHDLLYDLCLEKGKEEKFIHLADESSIGCNIHPSSGLPKYNHHRICIGEGDSFIKSDPIVMKKELVSSPLHTFMWMTKSGVREHFGLQFLASSKILTVLKLKLKEKVFPKEILYCIYLTHLELHFLERISNIQPMVVIPPTIASLRKLRTLIYTILEYKTSTSLPLSMWDMESLRHVDVSDCILDSKGFDLKSSSESSIERLGTLFVGEDYSETIEVLRKSSNLRKLKLRYEVQNKRRHTELLPLVVSLLPRLESLSIQNIGLKNPTNWSFPNTMWNLTKLTLYAIGLPWSVLTEFGKQLPNLRVLKLRLGAFEGNSWKLEDEDFSNLIHLEISMSDIEDIDVSTCDYPLPCLEHLSLSLCSNIMEIPPAIGEISTLKTITTSLCSPELEISALGIFKEQRKYGNNSFQVFIDSREDMNFSAEDMDVSAEDMDVDAWLEDLYWMMLDD